jgi:DNA-binding MarR family transcriptional regulator
MPRSRKSRRASGGTGPRGPVLDLTGHIATKVAIFSNRLSRAASRFYRKHYGIGVVEWRIVMCIGRTKETRANRICWETDLDKGAVSRSLATLEQMGIVSVKEDGADGRRNNVRLTPKGRALHDELVPIAIERQQRLVSGLAPEEVRAFSSLVDRLQAKVSNGEPQLDDPLPKSMAPARSPPKRTHRNGSPRRHQSRRPPGMA